MISEATLDNRVTGMAQTLANLFDNYPRDLLLFCAPGRSSGRFKIINSISYRSFVFTNRALKKLIPLKLRNRYFEQVKLPAVVKKILRFNPDRVVVSNLDHDPCLIALSLLKKRNVPLCVYLMDHIFKENESVNDRLAASLMKIAGKHIFISKYMAVMCKADYPYIANWTILHNPVEEKDIAAVPVLNARKENVTFAYAGSLWPMHIDAILLFAKAIQKIKNNKASLTIYTASHFYRANKRSFEELKISYGGFYRFDVLKHRLLQHNALLVASSFEAKYHDLSAYSVQTKVTDYLACGVPVIAIGPPYAACNKFLKENHCGFSIESGTVEGVTTAIEAFLGKETGCIKKEVNNGLALIRARYTKNNVQDKLYHFLSA